MSVLKGVWLNSLFYFKGVLLEGRDVLVRLGYGVLEHPPKSPNSPPLS